MATSQNGHHQNAPNADLLRSALANHRPGSHRLDPEDIERTGYLSGTASGVATPRPSGTDKRLPGILHNFFGQVGTKSPASRRRDGPPSVHDFFEDSEESEEEFEEDEEPSGRGTNGISLPSAKHSLVNDRSQEKENGVVLSIKSSDTQTTAAQQNQRRVEKQDDLKVTFADVGDIPKKNSKRSKPKTKKSCHVKPSFSLPLRGHGVIPVSTPSSLLTTDSAIHTPYISNPSSSTPSTTPGTPSTEVPLSGAQQALNFFFEQVRLTNGNIETDLKATPPITPRTLSNDGADAAASDVAPSPIEPPSTRGNSTSFPQTETSARGAPVSNPKGKLVVTISGARGLRPSFDPYAVCVFEWIESIAHGHKSENAVDDDESRSRENSTLGVPIKRAGAESGRSMAIPMMRSRQSSTTSLSDQKDFKNNKELTDPQWEHEAVFDVVGDNSNVEVYVYDRGNSEAFLGYVNVSPDVFRGLKNQQEGWYKLEARDPSQDQVTGEIHLKFRVDRSNKKKLSIEDFEFLRLVGKGTFGQVYQVRKKDTQQILALKMLSKKVIIQKKEVEHTIGERNILVRTASADSPFIVGLKYSFQTPTDLFLVTGFMSGGELFNHLQKAGRFDEARAKFYIAELILALQHLHKHDIVYRDLKPENILLDANGHIALCDFGLSKANLAKDETTNTFCGTTEYLAPEVLLDEQGYTKMVDFWSLGVLVFEMCCGWSPFYAEDTQQMYKNIAFGKVRFPKDTLSTEGRNFVKGLLNRNPRHRLGATRDAEELKEHRFFSDTDWDAIMSKSVVPPFKPKLKNILDVSNFDPEFTEAYKTPAALNEKATQLAGGGAIPASTPLSPGMQANFKGFTFTGDSHMDEHFKGTELEKMDEHDEEMNEDQDEPSNVGDDWEHVPNAHAADRMSGILKTSSNDDAGVFNNGHFDM